MTASRFHRPLAAIAVAACFLLSPSARADPAEPSPHDEVYGSFGVVTVQDVGVVARNIVDTVAGDIMNGLVTRLGGTPGNFTITTTGTVGAIGLGYNHYVTPRWTLGLFGNYQGFTRTLTVSSGASGQIRDDFVTLMARTDFRWVNGSVVQLYSGIAVGGNYIHSYEVGGTESLQSIIGAGQLNLLGIRAGASGLGVFLEIGFGWNGLLAGGISARF